MSEPGGRWLYWLLRLGRGALLTIFVASSLNMVVQYCHYVGVTLHERSYVTQVFCDTTSVPATVVLCLASYFALSAWLSHRQHHSPLGSASEESWAGTNFFLLIGGALVLLSIVMAAFADYRGLVDPWQSRDPYGQVAQAGLGFWLLLLLALLLEICVPWLKRPQLWLRFAMPLAVVAIVTPLAHTLAVRYGTTVPMVYPTYEHVAVALLAMAAMALIAWAAERRWLGSSHLTLGLLQAGLWALAAAATMSYVSILRCLCTVLSPFSLTALHVIVSGAVVLVTLIAMAIRLAVHRRHLRRSGSGTTIPT